MLALTLGSTPIDLELHVEVYLLCAGMLLAYGALIRRYGPLFHPRPGDRAVAPWQVASFVGGVLAIWLASGSPLHDLAERYLYSAHMIQHLLQAFVAPPLLLLGLPEWMFELLTRNPRVRAVVRLMGRPLLAAVAFNGVVLLIHWPTVVSTMVASEMFHSSSHIVLITVALAMWLPVVSPAEGVVPRLPELPRMFYLFLMTLLPTIPSSFLTFGETPLFQAYEAFPRVWGITALSDMQVAGLIMKIGGGFYLWAIITVLFFRWAAAEERRDRRGGETVGAHPSISPTRNR